MQPGSRLRNARNVSELTYRDVERGKLRIWLVSVGVLISSSLKPPCGHRESGCNSQPLSLCIGRHIHLDERGLQWYDVPFQGHFADGQHLPAPNTHLAADPPACVSPYVSIRRLTRAVLKF